LSPGAEASGRLSPVRRFPPLLVSLVALALGACRGEGRARVGALEPVGSAGADPVAWVLPAEVLEAERAIRDLRGDRAEAVLEAAGGVSPLAPERSWILLDLWLTRGAIERARTVTDALPEHPMSTVLRAHARGDPADRRRRVRPVLATPVRAWAHLETAIAFAEEGHESAGVASNARAAQRGASVFVRREALLIAAREALEIDRGVEAAALAEEAARLDPADPRAPALLGRAQGRVGHVGEAAMSAWQTLRLAPKSGRAARRVADLLREGTDPALADRIRAEIGPLLAGPNPPAELLALAGVLDERKGEVAAAASRYEAALRGGADPVPVDRDLRRLRITLGRRREAVAALRRAVPPDVIVDPRNRLAPAWALLARVGERIADGPSSAVAGDDLVELAEALVAVGAVAEAKLALEGVASSPAAALRARVSGELAFEAALRGEIEEGYRAPARGDDPPALAEVLGRVAVVARRHLVADEQAAFDRPETGLRRVPLLGAWLDHGADTSSPVVAHFRRYGKYLMLGQREGKPTEVVLLSLASLTRQQEIPTQGRVFHHDVAVGYDRAIRPYLDFQGGTLSGAALPDGVWLDADAARRDDHAVRSTLRILDPVYLARLDALAHVAPAVDGIEGPFALDDPAALAVRLARRYAARAPDEPWGSFDVLRRHEFGHVLDLTRHLPILKGLPATIALVASEGFALERVEARLEGRAQLASVSDARDPDLALLDLVRALPVHERLPEAHERGYRDVVAGMLRWLNAHASEFPAVDPTRKLLPQLDRLAPEEVRRMGRAVAAQGWPAE